MFDRDLVLVLTGGLIGSLSSLFTLLVVYWLEGMRLRRKWQREDQLLLREKRADLENLLSNAMSRAQTPPEQPHPSDSDAIQSG